MAILERKKLGDKYRAAVNATVLAYNEESRERGDDPLDLNHLNMLGSVMLGKELADKMERNAYGKADSVWWVSLDPVTGAFARKEPIAGDLSKWRKELNRQLKEWGTTSAIRELQKKRLKNGLIVAAIATAVAVATLVTAGAALGPGAGALSGVMTAFQATGAWIAGAGGIAGLTESARVVLDALPERKRLAFEREASETSEEVESEIETGNETIHEKDYSGFAFAAFIALIVGLLVFGGKRK